MRSQQHSSHCAADELACIASYFSSASQRLRQQPHGRLPLAWVAASPSARLVAEQRNAWVVLPFDSTSLAGRPHAQGEDEGNVFGAALANATTPLFILHDALGLDAAGLRDFRSVDSTVGRCGAFTTGSSGKRVSFTSLVAKVMSWISQMVAGLADVDHAASSVGPHKPALLDTSRAKPPPRRSTRPSTGVRGPRVEDPLEAARSCGVHAGGLTVVLVSGVHLYESSLLRSSHVSQPSPAAIPNSPDNASRHDSKKTMNPSATLLFPSTTSCGGSVSSLLSVPPNAAAYDSISACNTRGDSASASAAGKTRLLREGAVLHQDDGGAENETAHDPQTAASVYTVQQVNKLHEQVCGGHVADAYNTVWYRHVFLDAEEVVANVLCGVSQWWLRRPVRLCELPSTSVSKLQRQQQAHCKDDAAQPSLLSPPLLYVKFIADIGAGLWWPRRLLSVVRHRFAERQWCPIPLLCWVELLWLFIVVVVKSVVSGVPDAPLHRPASTQQDAVDLAASFHTMGEVYGGKDQLAALDVSHTSVRGVHLLACALGKVSGACKGASEGDDDARLSTAVDRFRALDVAGCIQLHHRQSEMRLLAAQLKALDECLSKQAREALTSKLPCPLLLVGLLMTRSFGDEKTHMARSASGLALALLSHHGSLTWVSGAGCSLDNAALHELGRYALLVEAAASTPLFSCPHSAAPLQSSCSITAMDLTSALSLDNLNPAAYLPHLEQLLVPFTYVTDDGVARLDGHTYPHDLRALSHLHTEEMISTLEEPTQTAMKDLLRALEKFTPTSSESTAYSMSPNAEHHAHTSGSRVVNHAVEALHQRFRSHLYHIDFAYCSCLYSVNGLVRQQRLELLNVSQTRVSKAGLFANAETLLGSPASSSSIAGAPRPPLRLFIAEMCERLNDLSGLAHISTLECIIVRSGSLGDDGLRSVCTKNMVNLRLMDLSYCDRLHHVGCLATLPALETLILDSTDVTPAEVRALHQSRSLETLSVRFCTEFAFIGGDRAALEEAVGVFPRLKYYLYEDLTGDGELRKKTS
ncbi:hypothetical protein ABL78_6633 [Leptomonas seymouri]|uniref:Leucine-rich repeat protein n=1 Tax=Leptomonas seymouri TaxID=5684 RepID=A0A0N1HTI4_LEPSE|nr:hypothetical protein ABL78_6633 [Leptomonas seymouri]|eukprot:KPI84310.1 hypothetical protein ABL78_6633 [Leptomonas seymouri]